MSNARRTFVVHEPAREEAIRWFIAFCEDEVDPPECEQFETWLRASPEHVGAYLQISAFWEAAGGLNRTRKLPVDEIVRRAAAEHNIVELNPNVAPASSAAPAKPRIPATRWSRWATAASLILACLAGATATWWQLTRHDAYVTQVGEERTIALPDGSIVQLNSRSRLRVHYTEAQRSVELLDGQALFRVASNPSRPFVVTSGGISVRAVGTQFDVYRKVEGTVVTVVDGRVAVSNLAGGAAQSATPTPLMLAAGDQVTVSPNAVGVPKHTNPSVATAWTQGKLVFNETPLAEVVQEVNRYNPRPLFIDDPKLLSLHVSGTFATTDSAQIIQFLAARFGLVMHESPDGIRLSHE